MRGKSTTERRRIQMLHYLANIDGYVALELAAEDSEVLKQRERMTKTCCTQKTTTDDDDDYDDVSAAFYMFLC